LKNSLRQRPPVLLLGLAVAAVFLSLAPVSYLVVRLFEYGTDKVVQNIFRARSLELLGNSVLLAVAVALAAVAVGGFQAWLTARTSIRGRAVFAILAALPLAMPSYVSAYSFTALFPGFKGFFAAWLILTIGTAPYVYLAVSAALIRSDAATEEVARSLGSGRLRVFTKVTWPTIRPAAVSGGMLSILYSLSDFGAVSILGFDTFTRAIYSAYRSSFDRTGAASLAAILVVLTVLILVIEPALRGKDVNVDSRVRRSSPISLGWFAPIAVTLASAWAVVSLAIPVFSLISWNQIGLSQVDTGQVTRALVNSIGYAFGGGLIAVVFGLAISILTVRYKSKITVAFDRSIWLTHAVPGIVVALALVFLSNRLLPQIYQTSTLVLIAYLILFLPNAIAAMQVPISQAPRSLDEIAASLGATRLQTVRKVIIPIAGPGILAGAALVALSVLKELPATLLLRETGVETLATRLWNETSVSAYAAAAPYALLLVVVGGIPAWLLNRQVRQSMRFDLNQRMERE
jgi:iron(III) transport system permease protein